jgi:hypothetical protein
MARCLLEVPPSKFAEGLPRLLLSCTDKRSPPSLLRQVFRCLDLSGFVIYEKQWGEGRILPNAYSHLIDLTQDALEAANNEVGDTCCFCVNFLELADDNFNLLKALAKDPKSGLDVLNHSFIEAQKLHLELNHASTNFYRTIAPQVRFTSLPFYLDVDRGDCFPSTARMRTLHAGMLASISGTVTKIGPAQAEEILRAFICTKCGHRWLLPLPSFLPSSSVHSVQHISASLCSTAVL